MSAFSGRQIARRAECGKIDLFLNTSRYFFRFGRIERQPKLKENVLKSHQPETDVPPAAVRGGRARDRVIVQVDDAVELTHGEADVPAKLFVIDSAVFDISRHVYRTEIAHGCFVIGRDLDDLGAEIR